MSKPQDGKLLDQKIEHCCRKVEHLMTQMAKKIPSKNLPLVNLDGLSDSVKLIIEKRLKGSNRRASLNRSRKIKPPKQEPDWDREAEIETTMTTYEHGGEVG